MRRRERKNVFNANVFRAFVLECWNATGALIREIKSVQSV